MKKLITISILLLLFSCSNSENKIQYKKELLNHENIKSIYLKSKLYGKDSMILNSKQTEYFIKQWNVSNSIGMWKYIPKYWLKVEYNNGKKTYFRNNGKLIKQENDFTYQLNDTLFIKSLWKNHLIDIEPKIKLELFELNKRNVCTGQMKLINGKTFTTGIEFKKVSNNRIEYQYTELIDWKKTKRINGIAFLVGEGEIKDRYNKTFVTYKLKDTINEIEIHFTKKKQILTRVYRNKKKSPIMYGK